MDMAQRQKLTRRESQNALRGAIRSSHNEAQKNRLRAILCIKTGMTHTAVARQFVVCRTTIASWVKAYNKGGIAALNMSQGGRPEGTKKWSDSIFTALAKEIDKGGSYWSVPLMQVWIKEHHEQDIPAQTIWQRLCTLRYSYKSARPHPYQGNAEKQEAFKKGAPAKLRF